MSITQNAVYKLEKELAFWQRIHENEPIDECELKLERQIRQLANPDEFGIPRYNGHIEDDEDEEEYEYTPRVIGCRYCRKTGLKWVQVEGKWRLSESSGLHVCDAYKNRRNQSR